MPVKRTDAKKRKRSKSSYTKSSKSSLSIYKPFTRNMYIEKSGKYLKTVLTYSDVFTMNPGLGGTAVSVWSMNGLYDPDIAGVGHQPGGFDEFMALYQTYYVRASSIKVQFWNEDGGTEVLCGLCPMNQSGPASDWRRYVETGSSVWSSMGYVGNAQASPVTLKGSMKLDDISGKPTFQDSSYEGTSASNPTNQCYWHVFASPVNTAADPAALRILIELEYEVYFRDIKLQTLS